jgi:hypothetical protein
MIAALNGAEWTAIIGAASAAAVAIIGAAAAAYIKIVKELRVIRTDVNSNMTNAQDEIHVLHGDIAKLKDDARDAHSEAATPAELRARARISRIPHPDPFRETGGRT